MNLFVLKLLTIFVISSSLLFAQSKKLVKASDKSADADGEPTDLFVDVHSFKKKGDTLFYRAHYIEQANKKKSYEFDMHLLFSRCSPSHFVPESMATESYKYEWNKIIAIYQQTLKNKKKGIWPKK